MLTRVGTANELGHEDSYSNISVFKGIQQYVDILSSGYLADRLGYSCRIFETFESR